MLTITTNNSGEAAKYFFDTIQHQVETDGKVIIALKGDLGAGKTTLVQEFCKMCGVQDVVTSPTFPIMNVYEGEINEQKTVIHHFDWYRLDSMADLGVINLPMILSQLGIFFIEWPEKLPEVLGDYEHYVLSIDIEGESRIYNLEKHN
ncbi:MAG TPA: tRNA (adenosine(37)-N6)-threonylcarbamoyltransferase complex ATPase subunit type 1 TsaE [Candidatus Paceibacterota bacterium]